MSLESQIPQPEPKASLGPYELMAKNPDFQLPTWFPLTSHCWSVGGSHSQSGSSIFKEAGAITLLRASLFSPRLTLHSHCLDQSSLLNLTFQCPNICLNLNLLTSSPGLLSCAPICLSPPGSTFSFFLSKSLSSFQVHFKFHVHDTPNTSIKSFFWFVTCPVYHQDPTFDLPIIFLIVLYTIRHYYSLLVT